MSEKFCDAVAVHDLREPRERVDQRVDPGDVDRAGVFVGGAGDVPDRSVRAEDAVLKDLQGAGADLEVRSPVEAGRPQSGRVAGERRACGRCLGG
jgi:hypothetical protein